jgi:hypothetical protein
VLTFLNNIGVAGNNSGVYTSLGSGFHQYVSGNDTVSVQELSAQSVFVRARFGVFNYYTFINGTSNLPSPWGIVHEIFTQGNVLFFNTIVTTLTNANGTYDFYYANEIPKAEYSYRNFMLEGKFVEYFETGHFEQIPASEEDRKQGIIYREQLVGTQVKRKGSYVNGQLHGEITYFNIVGEVEKIEVYEMGKLKETK